MDGQLAWYVARSTGLVGWALLTASVVWGLGISTKVEVGGRRPRPKWMLEMHRTLGALATIFTAVHVLALIADSYVAFDLVSVLVPFASSWQPVAVAWGVVGLYLLLAVELTSLARVHLSRKVWRMVHFASLPLFAVATVHALAAGTDAGSALFVLAAATAVLTVGVLVARRVRDVARPSPSRSIVDPVAWGRRVVAGGVALLAVLFTLHLSRGTPGATTTAQTAGSTTRAEADDEHEDDDEAATPVVAASSSSSTRAVTTSRGS